MCFSMDVFSFSSVFLWFAVVDDSTARRASRTLVVEAAPKDTQAGRSRGTMAPPAHLARLDS